MKMILTLILLLCSILKATEDIQDNFKLIFKISTENINKVIKNVEIIQQNQMYIEKNNDQLTLGVLIINNFKHKVIFFDENGNLVKETASIDNLYNILGDAACFRYLDSKIYFDGDNEHACYIKDNTFEIIPSPWLEYKLREQYHHVDFQYKTSTFGYCPLFTIKEKLIYTIDMTGLFTIWTREKFPKFVAKYMIPLSQIIEDSDFILGTGDLIIGKYGNAIFLWTRINIIN